MVMHMLGAFFGQFNAGAVICVGGKIDAAAEGERHREDEQ